MTAWFKRDSSDTIKPSLYLNTRPELAIGTTLVPGIRSTLPRPLSSSARLSLYLHPGPSPSCWTSRAVPAWLCGEGWMAPPRCPPSPCCG